MKNEIKMFIINNNSNIQLIEQLSNLKNLSNISLVESIINDIELIEKKWDDINIYMNILNNI